MEDIVGKGDNTVYQHFLYFPQCFQKGSYYTVIVNQDYVVKI